MMGRNQLSCSRVSWLFCAAIFPRIRRGRSRRSTLTPRSFTLIELLVVVAIISILFSILMPSLKKALIVSRRISCGNRMKQIGFAVSSYANDYDGWFPPCRIVNGLYTIKEGASTTWMLALAPYLNINYQWSTHKDPRYDHVYRCPGRAQHGDWTYGYYVDYAANRTTFVPAGVSYDMERVLACFRRVNIVNKPSIYRMFMDLETPDNLFYFGPYATSPWNSGYIDDDTAYKRHGTTVNILHMDGHVMNKRWPFLPYQSEAECWEP